MKSFNLENKENLKKLFYKEGFVYVNNFVNLKDFLLLKEIYKSLSFEEMRKDFLMPQSGNTPRHINVIGGKTTNDNSLLMQFYRNKDFINSLTEITDNDVCECPEIVENVIFTCLNREGDTHGWHKDDYPIAVIIGLESPDKGCGGELEYISKDGTKKTVLLEEGDAYIMRSDILAHRVKPLLKETRRTILNFTYSFNNFSVKPNGSAYSFCE